MGSFEDVKSKMAFERVALMEVSAIEEDVVAVLDRGRLGWRVEMVLIGSA